MNPWRPILWNTLINDQDDGPQCTLSKPADDTKLASVAHMPDGYVAIQRDLQKREKWADKNLLKLTKEQWPVLHLWRNNPRHQHMLGAQKKHNSVPLWQRRPAAFWAVLRRASMEGWGKWPFLSAQHLECLVQIWTLHYRRDMDILQPVQQSSMKMIKRLDFPSRGLLSMSINTWWGSKDHGARLFSVTGQGVMGINQQIPPKHKEKLFYYEDGQRLEQIPQQSCGVFILGDILDPTEHSSEWPVTYCSCLCFKQGWMISRDTFQPRLFFDSAMILMVSSMIKLMYLLTLSIIVLSTKKKKKKKI